MKRILLTSIIALSTAFGANAELIEADFNQLEIMLLSLTRAQVLLFWI